MRGLKMNKSELNIARRIAREALLRNVELDITVWKNGRIVAGGIDGPWTHKYYSQYALRKQLNELKKAFKGEADKITVTSRYDGTLVSCVKVPKH
jgi:hypothetical protein